VINVSSTPNVTEEEIVQAADILSRLEAGFLPFPIFIQAARLVVLSIIELVPLRLGTNGTVEVLLLPRATDDVLWPGMTCTPGTVVRPTDSQENYHEAFERIFKDELKIGMAAEPVYVGHLYHRTRRGAESARIHYVELGQQTDGQFFDVENLPGNTVESHVPIIKMAAECFRAHKMPSSASVE
jgi:hypothetical protein